MSYLFTLSLRQRLLAADSREKLVDAGHRVVLYDNRDNSDAPVVDHLEKISGTRMP